MLSTRYCHCRISRHSRDIRNTTVDIDQWKTSCIVSIPIFFIVIKLNINLFDMYRLDMRRTCLSLQYGVKLISNEVNPAYSAVFNPIL